MELEKIREELARLAKVHSEEETVAHASYDARRAAYHRRQIIRLGRACEIVDEVIGDGSYKSA